jgi:hypothetical protein
METARLVAGPDAIRLLMAEHHEIDACFEALMAEATLPVEGERPA